MVTNKLENYLTLLSIRQAGRRRDTIITGGIFLISFVSMIALGLIDKISGRSLYLVSALVVVFGISYLMTWIKLEIIKGMIELIGNI